MAAVKDNTYWLLVRVAITTKHHLMSIAEQHGLTGMQLYTLCLLEADMSVPMNLLSSMLYCDASNITGIVDRLLSQEYIKREENPKDRREKMITLTQKGAELCNTFSHLFESYIPESLQALSKTEQQQLHTLLRKIVASQTRSLSSA
jgi:DNA-binding MarR family transcriptional regulator